MRKRSAHHLLTRLRPLRSWYFFALALVCAVTAVFAYRSNNLTMIRLRQAVFQADEQNGDVEKALQGLREYVHTHMGTDLTPKDNSIYPPIQLKHRYERLVAAEQAKIATENSKLYTDAQAECERRVPSGLSGSGRIPCIQEYVASHGLREAPIPDALYKFDFVSPRWSPDLAGWSLVFTVVFASMFVVRAALGFALRMYTRR